MILSASISGQFPVNRQVILWWPECYLSQESLQMSGVPHLCIELVQEAKWSWTQLCQLKIESFAMPPSEYWRILHVYRYFGNEVSFEAFLATWATLGQCNDCTSPIGPTASWYLFPYTCLLFH